MMMLPKKCIAIKALLLLALLAIEAGAYAAPLVGSVTNLSGHLLSKKADGTLKILAQKSAVEQGDTLVTAKDTYARIKFLDNSEITLQPNSQIKIENFTYDAKKPESDNAIFGLLKGGLRAITGLLGKRSRERFSLKTPSATIGIRGTIFIAEYIPDETSDSASAAYGLASMASVSAAAIGQADLAQPDTVRTDAPLHYQPASGIVPLQLALTTPIAPIAPIPGAKSPGLYVQVLDGMIQLTNRGGSQSFSAGQFGYTPSFIQPPVVVPANPGIQFTPPPSFSSSSGQPGGTGNKKSAEMNCQVR